MFEREEQPKSATVARRAVPSVAQAKLVVGAANDPLEAEADRVADEVLATLQRRVATSSPAVPEAVAHRCDDGCVHRHLGHDAAAHTAATGRGDGDPRADADEVLVAGGLGPTTRIARHADASPPPQSGILLGRVGPLAARVQRHAGLHAAPDVGHAGAPSATS